MDIKQPANMIFFILRSLTIKKRHNVINEAKRADLEPDTTVMYIDNNKIMIYSICIILFFAKNTSQIVTMFDKPNAAPIHIGCWNIPEKSSIFPDFS